MAAGYSGDAKTMAADAAEAPFPSATQEQIRRAVLHASKSAVEAIRQSVSELPEPIRNEAAQFACDWANNTVRFENAFGGVRGAIESGANVARRW